MKGIIIKLIFVFSITIVISAVVGVTIGTWATHEDFNLTINGVVQTDYSPTSIGWQFGLAIFGILTICFSWFYIINISILISTYIATKKIENKNIVYQRDLADDYNSAVASYIVDGTIEVKQDYQAVLIELETKGLIYNENGIYKVKKENIQEEELLLNQKVVLEQIQQGIINFHAFKKAVIKDANNLGYTKRNDKLILLIAFLTFTNPIGWILIVYTLLGTVSWIMELTEKGKKEKDKILKLKQYLINFSELHQVETTNYNIWGEYLAYAISLKVNKKLKVKKVVIGGN